MEEQTDEVIKEVSKEIAKDVYEDGGKPIVKPTGQTLGLIPRAIKAALLPVEKWILSKEYNLKETEKMLEEKLKNMTPENIVTPEAYIAVPSIQYISYCMDSEELRNMYANLLANSMNSVVKNEVHPGFVEIIKQLSPDEAKILKELYLKKVIPVITIRYENEQGEGIDIFKEFSDIAEKANCEEKIEINKYFDNLKRLGLIDKEKGEFLVNESLYEPLKCNEYIKSLEKIPENLKKQGYTKYVVQESFIRMTKYGEVFCKICVVEEQIITIKM